MILCRFHDGGAGHADAWPAVRGNAAPALPVRGLPALPSRPYGRRKAYGIFYRYSDTRAYGIRILVLCLTEE